MPGEWPCAAAAPEGCVILGVDPGTRVVGWGVVRVLRAGPCFVAAGALRPSTKLGVPERLAWIRRDLDRLLLEHRPQVVVVEQAFAALNPQSALRIGEGRGVALSCAAAFGAHVAQYPPAAAKKALTGHGQAHKTQVAAMVGRLLHLEQPPEPLDASDALCLALAHLLRATGLHAPARVLPAARNALPAHVRAAAARAAGQRPLQG